MTLRAPRERLPALIELYGRNLGLATTAGASGDVSFGIGETTVEFVPDSGEPFYHFALLVPGDRFEAALEWVEARLQLLPDPDSRDVVFDFDNWSARACYFEDPAGNVVELIAHAGIGDNGVEDAFRPHELLGLSELGLVGDPAAMYRALASGLGLELWDGTVENPGRLAFVGERARTLILSPPGRGWLPTGRPAAPCPVDALLTTAVAGDVELEGGRHRIRATAAAPSA